MWIQKDLIVSWNSKKPSATYVYRPKRQQQVTIQLHDRRRLFVDVNRELHKYLLHTEGRSMTLIAAEEKAKCTEYHLHKKHTNIIWLYYSGEAANYLNINIFSQLHHPRTTSLSLSLCDASRNKFCFICPPLYNYIKISGWYVNRARCVRLKT